MKLSFDYSLSLKFEYVSIFEPLCSYSNFSFSNIHSFFFFVFNQIAFGKIDKSPIFFPEGNVTNLVSQLEITVGGYLGIYKYAAQLSNGQNGKV